ncbi:UDP-glucuronosyltransferase 2A1-like isoform X9 [Hemiscyllium ocellatum]|uniref:UDP-glucuronosyltransferase 2A1-like isoform X9 n=2 Tax=Hemiscyllium ocellatum TaxID=170820 RepID=UPI0029673302|nr:UDP-glucuronosyltransferase 2A1-like isoform X9 [Hemiscyllium ocellatum]
MVIMQLRHLFPVFLFLQRATSENVLIWPAEGSHWINLKPVIEELIERGHNVTVVVYSSALFIKQSESSSLKFEVFEVSFAPASYQEFLKESTEFFMYEKPFLSYWAAYRRFSAIMANGIKLARQVCDGILQDHKLLRKLQEAKFKVLLADPLHCCGDLLALKLGIPFIFTMRFSPGFSVERFCGQIPAPPSYVPATLSEFTDKMTFIERVQNIIYFLMYDLMCNQMWNDWDIYYSKVLDGSHWINLKPVIEELIERGHNVTVTVHTSTVYINYSEPSSVMFEVFDVPFTRDRYREFFNDILHFWIYEKAILSYGDLYRRFTEMVRTGTELNTQICDGIIKNHKLLKRLKETKFKVLLTDPINPCGDLLAMKLGIPFIFTLRFSLGSSMERFCGQLPAPPSYVPVVMSELSDKMTFTERFQNILYLQLYSLMNEWFWHNWDAYYSEALGKPTTFCETMGKAEIWLIRTYWDFEFPRPLLPNFVFVGGLHCHPAKPLSQELEEFVQSSGEHGVVIFSLGSLVKNLTAEKANIIAEALGEIPQKVLWSYAGEKPKMLASNTKLYKWLPQNDLLGHPKTRVFITHGGTNGIYEAIYHGVPMIGIPLFADQPDNMAHMKAKGAAVVLNFISLTKQDLINAVNTVINDTSYKENALKLSRIQHDQPMTPLERAVFWIEFVMRHGGAQHLRPEAHSLSWYQYHCLDVIAFLFICLAAIVFALKKCCMFCCQKCRGTREKKNKVE